ncbi:hypothetical protein DPMN_147243 [Dreissena polymorpha]|uniref:Mutator-like transposase domain-containing protein n=1 Tax=Dreissena polymorpha TaxID=45954 RepID=A0A9D4FBV8_DREPO|nr:hypothetical protein DPMN_147243 [Dreissena polymorpha]
MVFVSKKKQKLLDIGYKRGESSRKRGIQHKYGNNSSANTRYERLERSAFIARIHTSDNILTFHDVDGSETPVKPLRPRVNRASYVDRFKVSASSKVHPDLRTNKIYVPALLQTMMSTENRKHRLCNSKCRGDLVIDGVASIKWGFGWKERLKCTRCLYVGKHYKLFNEVNTKGKGRRSAEINIGFQIGVASTSIGNTSSRRIMNTSNIIAPTPNAMQKQANKVCAALKCLNEKSMAAVRKNLVAENAQIGQKDASMVNVEGDTCYNNPIFNSDATPFQAGNHCCHHHV